MKKKTTFSIASRICLMLWLSLLAVHAWAQKPVYATEVAFSDNTSNPVYATDGNLITADTLRVHSGALAGLGSYDGFLAVNFQQPVPRGNTVFVKFGVDNNELLKGLLGGSVGKALSGLLNGLLLGSHTFEITAIDALGKDLVKQKSSDGFASENMKLVQGEDGSYYAMINTPQGDIKSLTFSNDSKAVAGLLASEKKFFVYDSFYYPATASSCGRPFGTSFDSKGIEVNLLGGLVNNKFTNAIDNDPNSYSMLKSEGLININLLGSISQFFYYENASSSVASFNITLGFDRQLVDVKLLSGLEVLAYHGSEVVYRQSLQGGLLNGTDVLGLLQAKEKATLTFAPGRKFDRIEVRANSTADINLLNSGVKIYDVERFDGDQCVNPNIVVPAPTKKPFDQAACAVNLIDFSNVDFPTQAIDGNNESFATLNASSGSLLSSLPTQGSIELGYNQQVPANTTSYIRIDADESLLQGLLSGTLGKLLNATVGSLLGDHYFKVEALNNGIVVAENTSQDGFSSTSRGAVTLVQDNIGRYYLAVTPNQPYQSVRITNIATGLVAVKTRKTLKVYDMCREISTAPCLPAQFTSYTQDGITVGVGITDAGVKNPYYAIDDNSSNYAQISTGTVAVGGAVKQLIYFSNKSEPGDELKVRIGINPNSILNLDLLGGYKVKTYLGGQEQENFTLQQGLINNLDLLGLLKKGSVETLTYTTSKIFDRVSVEAVTGLNVGLTEALRLYDVKRVNTACVDPKGISPFIAPKCADKLIDMQNVVDFNHLLDDDFNSNAVLTSDPAFLWGGEAKKAFVHLGYTNEVPANTTSYVRFDYDEKVLNGLLGGSLGNVVAGLLNGLLLGDHYFEVEVFNGESRVLAANSKELRWKEGNGDIRVVKDKQGRTYLAITPGEKYTSVKITEQTKALLPLGGGESMNIYGMCYETADDSCAPSFATSYEFDGLALDVVSLSGGGVENAERAIDDNSTNYSSISLGTLNIAGSVKQNIYFNTPSKADEVVNIRLKTGANIVDVDLLGKIEIKAYMDGNPVDSLDWNQGLINGINVLDILSKGQVLTVPFAPKMPYNSISVGMKTIANVSVQPSLYLYDVERTCQTLDEKLVSWKSYKVNDDASVTEVRGGELVEYTIHVRNEGTSDIPEIIVQDELPKGLIYESGGSLKGETVTFLTTSLAVGEEKTFVFKAKVSQDLTDIKAITNIAKVKMDAADTGISSFSPVNNRDPKEPNTQEKPGTILMVTEVRDFELTHEYEIVGANGRDVAEIGDEIIYTITVSNTGNQLLKQAVLESVFSNAIPHEVEFLAYGNGILGNQTVNFKVPDVAVGGSQQFEIKVKVNSLPNSSLIKAEAKVTGDTTTKTKEAVIATKCLPVKSEVITFDPIEEVCPNSTVVLKATLENLPLNLKNPIVKWYKKADLSDNPFTGLIVETLITENTTFYVTVEGLGYCFDGAPAEVTVITRRNLPKPTLVTSAMELCMGTSTVLKVDVADMQYRYLLNGQVIKMQIQDPNNPQDIKEVDYTLESELEVLENGSYQVQVRNDENECWSEVSDPIAITYKETPLMDIKGDLRLSTKINVPVKLPKVTSANANKVQWYDNTTGQILIGAEPDFVTDTAGVYSFTVVAELDGCVVSETAIVTVYDESNCPPQMERVYATGRTAQGMILTGGVSAKENAIDGDPTTHSTLVTGLGLLGIGTVWQNIYFDHEVPAGTPVTVKLGKEYSGLMLAGGLSVVGLDSGGSMIGGLQTVAGGLLDLLVADNVVEFTFVPSNSGGAKPYKGIRVSQGALVSVAQNAKVFGAYYSKPGVVNCAPVSEGVKGEVLDVLHGVADLSLGVASATASVSSPWNAVDEDPESYALISRGVAVLNEASLTVVFKQQAMPGDELHIVTEIPGNPVLSLELIKGYKIQRYLGSQPVGDPLTDQSNVLDLKLLGLGYGNKHKVIVAPFDQPYDRVKISYGSVVGVLGDFTRIYDVSMVPTVGSGISETKDHVDICQDGVLSLDAVDGCTIYEVYASEDVKDQTKFPELSTSGGLQFDMTGLPVGEQTVYVQNIRNGCAIGPRIPLKLVVEASPRLKEYRKGGEVLTTPYAFKVETREKVVLEAEAMDANTVITWEMEDVETGVWKDIPFGLVDTTTGVLTLEVPPLGVVEGVNYSERTIKVRAVLTSTSSLSCSTAADVIEITIGKAKKAGLKSNLNVTNKIK